MGAAGWEKRFGVHWGFLPCPKTHPGFSSHSVLKKQPLQHLLSHFLLPSQNWEVMLGHKISFLNSTRGAGILIGRIKGLRNSSGVTAKGTSPLWTCLSPKSCSCWDTRTALWASWSDYLHISLSLYCREVSKGWFWVFFPPHPISDGSIQVIPQKSCFSMRWKMRNYFSLCWKSGIATSDSAAAPRLWGWKEVPPPVPSDPWFLLFSGEQW